MIDNIPLLVIQIFNLHTVHITTVRYQSVTPQNGPLISFDVSSWYSAHTRPQTVIHK